MCADLGPDLGVAVCFCVETTSNPNRYIFRAYSSGSADFAKRSRASVRCVCERTVLTGKVRHHSASMTPARQPSGRKPAPAVQRDDEAEFETDKISAIPAVKAAKAPVAEAEEESSDRRSSRKAKRKATPSDAKDAKEEDSSDNKRRSSSSRQRSRSSAAAAAAAAATASDGDTYCVCGAAETGGMLQCSDGTGGCNG
eukprot:18308-Heterococcus_DN1.PRE.1